MVVRSDLSDRIIDLYSQFFNTFLTTREDAWLNVEVTMPQIKLLLFVASRGGATGSQLARGLGVGLPSVTRLVDRLCEHGLIARREDAEDRRVTYLTPTPEGRRLVESLNNYRREYLGAFLACLDLEQLQDVERGVAHLLAAAGGARWVEGSRDASAAGGR